MKPNSSARRRTGSVAKAFLNLILLAGVAGFAIHRSTRGTADPQPDRKPILHGARMFVDVSGYSLAVNPVTLWDPASSPEEIARAWSNVAQMRLREVEEKAAATGVSDEHMFPVLITKSQLHHSQGEPALGYQALEKLRKIALANNELNSRWLYTLEYLQGVSALRLGENENCIMCRGESSCILPISKAAQHTKPFGSRTAIAHFTEYLNKFPDDLEVRWLLNIAHMTLGEYPEKVEPKYLVSIDKFLKSEFDIGRFRDVAERAGVNRFNGAGGAILEDFDGDNLLDLAVTGFDPTQQMSFYHNKGDGTFEERTESAGVAGQYGGLYCVQTDYNNDGHMDIFIARGAWLQTPMRPTLLRNNGDGTFSDVTKEAGLLDPVNSITASWSDYDNDGWLDLFICCEQQSNRLYHNKKDGTFEEVAAKLHIESAGQYGQHGCKGSAWLDYDNDGDPDLFLNYLTGFSRFYRNDGAKGFTEVTMSSGIDGPRYGFSCWAFDFDNDGWLDIFSTSYDRSLEDVVKGLQGVPHRRYSNKLFHNNEGKGFVDVTAAAGLDMVFSTMGSNFGDFDNDGYLDFYLGTGEPNLATLVPNRMFRNVGGRRFAEITASSGTGHLQKGHAIACGDWDRDGDTDIFSQTGGAVKGDKYHNVFYENPGQGNHWLTMKLIGKKTNRAAIGARIKVVTAGTEPQTMHRHVTSGSSFGANTLLQTVGLARATNVATVEVHWPTSGTTQVFHDIQADQAIEITEFATDYRKLDWKPLPKAE
jgi:hypothetical protein